MIVMLLLYEFNLGLSRIDQQMKREGSLELKWHLKFSPLLRTDLVRIHTLRILRTLLGRLVDRMHL